jgi:hypothetical protein
MSGLCDGDLQAHRNSSAGFDRRRKVGNREQLIFNGSRQQSRVLAREG